MRSSMCMSALCVVLLAACGGSSGSPTSPGTPTPAPTPTPTPAGTIRFVSATLPAGSTVGVSPLNDTGQQAQSLAFTGAVTLTRDLNDALVRAHVRTDSGTCMGGGQARVTFRGNVERSVEPASMSRTPTPDTPVCPLPYSTTHVEFEVFDVATQQPVLTQRFPMAYNFVAAP